MWGGGGGGVAGPGAYILYKNYHWNVWILTKPGQILRVRTASGSRLAVPKFDNWTPRSARDERLDSFN